MLSILLHFVVPSLAFASIAVITLGCFVDWMCP
jgi:hypothetical protein